MICKVFDPDIAGSLTGRAGRRVVFILSLCFLGVGYAQERVDVAIVTALQGPIELRNSQGVQALQAFARLKRGDQLALSNTSIVKIVYYESGRQELWKGEGTLDILAGEGKGVGVSGMNARNLPEYAVRQIAKTPSDASLRRTVKSRSIAGGGSMERIDESYRRMKMEAVRGDLNPELFLLSALFEIREIDRVEQVLADLRTMRPDDQEARVVVALYQKAVRNLKEGGKR